MTMHAGLAAANTDMVDYYRRRAAIYERVYHKPERQADLRAMEAWLPQAFNGRDVLEIAAGTGWWTAHGARDCNSWLATDLNQATLDIARGKPLPPDKVEFALADAYDPARTLPPGRRFDAAFAGCWWSHVPLAALRPWLRTLHACLQPGARIVMLDNAYVQTSNLPITRRDAEGNTYQNRRLDDGSVHEVLKNFPTCGEAMAAITDGPRTVRDPQWIAHTHYWMLSYELD
jgi:demethylmenaquinone methyltransferase/2-methoxy-6-polyprenyl-1,4-benzoquinol methylase